MNSVLRWAGSKRKLLNELRALSPVCKGRYYEPFAGSAVLFFDLLPEKAVLADLNPEVISTYEGLRDSPEEVCDYLYSVPKTREAYYKIRALEPESLSKAQRAARLIYLMKGCFNGVYRTNRAGYFNVPFGSGFIALPEPSAIAEASSALQTVKLVCGDFSTALEGIKAGDFVYMDPPYSDGSRFRGEYSYLGAFQQSDQERLTSICRRLTDKGVKVLLSFKECESVCDALTGWTVKRLDVGRSVAGFAHARRRAREILAYNY